MRREAERGAPLALHALEKTWGAREKGQRAPTPHIGFYWQGLMVGAGRTAPPCQSRRRHNFESAERPCDKRLSSDAIVNAAASAEG